MTGENRSQQDPAPPPPVSVTEPGSAAAHGQTLVPFRAAVRACFLISLQTFGGPAGQIAVMQRELGSVLRTLGVCAALGLAAGLAGLPLT